MRLHADFVQIVVLATVSSGCAVPTDHSTGRSLPLFNVIGGETCDSTEAWSREGPHYPFEIPTFTIDEAGDEPLAGCGELGYSEPTIYIHLEWERPDTGQNDEGPGWAALVRWRRGDGGLDSLARVFDTTVSLGQSVTKAVAIPVIQDFDAIGILFVNGPGADTVAPLSAYFTNVPDESPPNSDVNEWFQLWHTVPTPLPDSARALSDDSIKIWWENGHDGGTHYSTEVARFGSVIDTVSGSATSYLDAAAEDGEGSYTLRHFSDPVILRSISRTELTHPASRFSQAVAPLVTNVTISGPSTAQACEKTSWTGSADGGTGLYSWKWYRDGVLVREPHSFYISEDHDSDFELVAEAYSLGNMSADTLFVIVNGSGPC